MAFRHRVGNPTAKGTWYKHFNISPDWSLYKEPKHADAIEIERERLRGRDTASELRKAQADLIEAQDIREGILGLKPETLVPRLNVYRPSKSKGKRTVIIHLSDWHCGEVVRIEEMDGVNSYDLSIFKKRVSRLAGAAQELLTTHWKGDAPEKIIVILGGDMISGEIHEELAKTNEALAAPAVKVCAEHMAGLLKKLAEVAPMDVYSLPGNHGRLTKKPESKGMAINSFDTLITNIVEMILPVSGTHNPVKFFYSKSGDALFRVYKLVFCAVHGDRIGSKGGQGFLGALATVIRGIAKCRAYYTGQGIIVNYFLTAHLHTTAKLPRGFANGSLVGPSEYSRDLRADPEEAKQNFIVIHSERGVIDIKELYCGAPEEGSIYSGQD